MKFKLIYFFIIFSFCIMLIFPDIVLEGAANGLLLWFEIVLPTLLPFLIVSSLLINTPAIHLLVHITSPLFCRLFRVSKYGSFAVLCGFLCGYPMGGKITNDLLCSNKITKTEAKYLLSFCNNTSPMFIISYVMHQSLNAPDLILPALCILILSPVLCSFLFRQIYPIYYKNNDFKNDNFKDFHSANSVTLSVLLDECIMKSFEILTKIGGYIILFSILIEIISSISFAQNIWTHILLSFIEITNGIFTLSNSMYPFHDKFIIILALISFGGWCSIAQTKSILSNTDIPLIPYIIQKLITALVTSLLAFVFFKLY